MPSFFPFPLFFPSFFQSLVDEHMQLLRQSRGRGVVKGQSLGKLTGCEDDFAAWLDQAGKIQSTHLTSPLFPASSARLASDSTYTLFSLLQLLFTFSSSWVLLERYNQLIQRGNLGNLDTSQLPRHLSQWKVSHFTCNFIPNENFFMCFRMAFFLPFLSYCVTYLVSAVALWQTGYVTVGY